MGPIRSRSPPGVLAAFPQMCPTLRTFGHASKCNDTSKTQSFQQSHYFDMVACLAAATMTNGL